MPSIAIFCRIIDNFGDAGVCLRLARRFARLGCHVTLMTDHLDVMEKLCPNRNHQAYPYIDIVEWSEDPANQPQHPDMVLETFGCRLPDAMEEHLEKRCPRTVIINLDYLSAEDWVESCHDVLGLHPTRAIHKTWFFPGFTDRTGGVIIRPTDQERCIQFNRNTFLQELGFTNPERPFYFFFAYPTNPIERLVEALRTHPVALNIGVTRGGFGEQLKDALQKVEHPHQLIRLPFVPQEDFDQFLWAADAAIIRGEDSFVRAQLAGTPFLWAIYPTEDRAHEIKFDAWSKRVLRLAPSLQEDFSLNANWICEIDTIDQWAQWLLQAPQKSSIWALWQQSLYNRGDLVTRILHKLDKNC